MKIADFELHLFCKQYNLKSAISSFWQSAGTKGKFFIFHVNLQREFNLELFFEQKKKRGTIK